MALAIAYDDAKTKILKRKNPAHKGNKILMFGSRDNPDLPHATLNQHDPGSYFAGVHFHSSDQFQVVVDGRFKIGRHDLSPYCVHFTRAYTPYGPLVSDGPGFAFLVMRTHLDEGAQPLVENRHKLKQVPNRQPWQISRAVTFPTFAETMASDIMLQAVPDIKDDYGLAAHTLSMKPNAIARTPDPAHGDGQYLVVVKGSLWHDNKEHKALALVFVKPDEGPYQIRAGSEGLQALVLNFPQVKPREVHTKVPSTAPGLKTWQCALCSFTYDEAKGMPAEGIPAGTRWEDVPETWNCPDCSSSKSDFQMVEV